MTTAAPTCSARHDPARLHRRRASRPAGFLAGYRGLTREAYALDLREFTSRCRARSLALFAVRRADIEGFARDLEERGRARATVTRRLSTIAGFYRYAVEEDLLSTSPAAHVRRPRVDSKSHAVALDRNELGALLVAGPGTPGEHALISLLALNGLRVSEATGADIEHLGLGRGHRTLTITRKGGKIVAIPLAPRTARAIDLAIGEHTEGPVFLTREGRRMDRHGAGRIVRKTARRTGIAKTVTALPLRRRWSGAWWLRILSSLGLLRPGSLGDSADQHVEAPVEPVRPRPGQEFRAEGRDLREGVSRRFAQRFREGVLLVVCVVCLVAGTLLGCRRGSEVQQDVHGPGGPGRGHLADG